MEKQRAPLRGALWALGALALLLPWWFRHPFFDQPWMLWAGLVTRLPVTEDWVPLLPWLGVRPVLTTSWLKLGYALLVTECVTYAGAYGYLALRTT